MTKYIGRRIQVGLAKETTRGAGAVPQIWLPITEFSISDKVEEARSEEGVGNIADSLSKFIVEKYAAGAMNGELKMNSFGYLLLAALGQVSSGVAVDSAYTHAFSLSTSNQHPSLSIDLNDPNNVQRYRLAMLSSLSIKAELGAVVKFESEFECKRSATAGFSNASYATESRFTKRHVHVKIADTIAGLAAASELSIKSFTLKLNKNIVRDNALGTVQPEDILNQQISVEGDLMLNYTDETVRNYMLNGNHKALQLVITNSEDSIGAGSTKPSLTIQLPRVDFSGWEPDRGLNDIATQKINFKGNRDVANALDVISTCTLVNGKSSYDA